MSDKIQIIRGDDQGITLYFTDENDEIIDITGATIFFTVKKNKADADANAVISVSTQDHINPAGGRTEIQLTHAQTVNLEPGDYFWDPQIKFPDGKIRSAYSDVLTVLPDITLRTS